MINFQLEIQEYIIHINKGLGTVLNRTCHLINGFKSTSTVPLNGFKSRSTSLFKRGKIKKLRISFARNACSSSRKINYNGSDY